MSILATNFIGFIVVLGFLIFAHESGHFLVAKLFKVRVLVFSFGFGKRLFGFRRGDTDYRVSLIPLGGYVRMAGDTPEENQRSNPDEFLSKPKWQRFLILLAGPGMNLLIAIGFLAGLNMVGLRMPAKQPMIVGEVTPGKPAARAGLTFGDRIVRINNEPIEEFEDLALVISLNANTPLHVEFLRNGQRLSTTMTPEKVEGDYGPIGRAGIVPFRPATVGGTLAGGAGERAGLQAGDRIVGAAGQPVRQMYDVEKALLAAKGAALPIDVARGNTIRHLVLPAEKPNEPEYPGFYEPTEFRRLGFVPAVRESFAQNAKMLKTAFASLRRLFRSEGSVKELSGPINIARISGEMMRRGWAPLVALMAMISLQLGIMNLLPIPVLDGGHIFILLIEGAARRDLSLRVKERIQQVGFAVLAALMIVVLYNDVISNVLRLRQG